MASGIALTSWWIKQGTFVWCWLTLFTCKEKRVILEDVSQDSSSQQAIKDKMEEAVTEDGDNSEKGGGNYQIYKINLLDVVRSTERITLASLPFRNPDSEIPTCKNNSFVTNVNKNFLTKVYTLPFRTRLSLKRLSVFLF